MTADDAGSNVQAAAERAKSDAALLGQFLEVVRQSEEMLLQSGVAADRSRDIAHARALLMLPEWFVVGCALPGEKQPDVKQLSMIEVRGPQGERTPSLAVFPTMSLAQAEIPRMQVPFEHGFWVTLAAPSEGVLEWIRSMKIPAISLVLVAGGNGPSSVLGLEFVEWVRKIEAEQRQAQQPPAP